MNLNKETLNKFNSIINSCNKMTCNHPKEKVIVNKLGMKGCLKCNTWITPYYRRF